MGVKGLRWLSISISDSHQPSSVVKIKDSGQTLHLPFNSQIKICNSSYCQPYNSYNYNSLENLVLDQLSGWYCTDIVGKKFCLGHSWELKVKKYMYYNHSLYCMHIATMNYQVIRVALHLHYRRSKSFRKEESWYSDCNSMMIKWPIDKKWLHEHVYECNLSSKCHCLVLMGNDCNLGSLICFLLYWLWQLMQLKEVWIL